MGYGHLGPECRHRVKSHLAPRTKTKTSNPGVYLSHVCPSSTVVPVSRAASNGKCREHGIQSLWDSHTFSSSSPHISVVDGLGYWGGAGSGGVLKEMK